MLMRVRAVHPDAEHIGCRRGVQSVADAERQRPSTRTARQIVIEKAPADKAPLASYSLQIRRVGARPSEFVAMPDLYGFDVEHLREQE